MKVRIAAILLLIALMISLILSGCKSVEPEIKPTETPNDNPADSSGTQQPADPSGVLQNISAKAGKSLADRFSGDGTGVMAEPGITIVLSDSGITVDGAAASSDPSAVYLSHDIIYYEDKTAYASGYPYGEGTEAERHSTDQAAAHTVVNITAPGTYRISGKLSQGQIRVDLGEDAFTDPTAVVTLILDNTDITCTVAPAVLFLNVYECDNGWSAETARSQVDTAVAGANVILAQDSKNLVTGSHVAKIFKDKEGEKKLWKQDAAFYSYMSMNINAEGDGSGTLDITADNEGLDSELHMTINGGHINIRAGNDGINTNEDGVSVTTINGGNLRIIAGLGEEGDGIDSNGWLVINGGVVISSANPAADAGLDSDMGSYVNGGIVLALGSTMDWAESDSEQVTMNLQFSSYKSSDSAIMVMQQDGTVVFAYDPSEDEVLGSNTRRYQGAVISCPNFAVGDSYLVSVGGTVTGTEYAGVYDPAAVTGYEGGTRQGYSGTDVTMRPGMGGFGGMGGKDFGGQRPGMGGTLPDGTAMPEGGKWFQNGQMPEGMTPPEGIQGGTAGDGQFQKPQRDPQQGGQFPEGMTPPEGFQGGQRPGMDGFGGMSGQAGTPENSIFYMQDKVNFFSGVSDI